MVYLYTQYLALDLPDSFTLTDGILHPETQFTLGHAGKIRVSTETETHLLELRMATEKDRLEAVNATGWCYCKQ